MGVLVHGQRRHPARPAAISRHGAETAGHAVRRSGVHRRAEVTRRAPMKNTVLGILILAAAVLTGCAHPMSIKPDLAALATSPVSLEQRIQKNVGLYISPADRAKLVTSKGGGGDKVTYAPYADTETGIYKVLGD